MDYQAHISDALLHASLDHTNRDAHFQLIRACGTCIAELASNASSRDGLLDLIDMIENAIRVETITRFDKKIEGQHGKPH